MFFDLLDSGYVRLVESWGSDERIVEAARMSTSKGFIGWGPKSCPECEGTGKKRAPMGPFPAYAACGECDGTGHVPGDEKLLAYLWNNKHTSPFEQAGLQIEVQAPIFVFREWHRHRTQSYNEMSGRYSVLPDLYYMPDLERVKAARQSKKNKQGSELGFHDLEAVGIQNAIAEGYRRARNLYDFLIERGVAREVARVIVPVGQYSRMRASANLWNWLRFLTLRTSPEAQWEIRQYADAVSKIVQSLFPRTWELWRAGTPAPHLHASV